MTEIDSTGESILPFPLQNALTRPLRSAAAKQGRAEFLSLWAGQAVRLARRQSAADLGPGWEWTWECCGNMGIGLRFPGAGNGSTWQPASHVRTRVSLTTTDARHHGLMRMLRRLKHFADQMWRPTPSPESVN